MVKLSLYAASITEIREPNRRYRDLESFCKSNGFRERFDSLHYCKALNRLFSSRQKYEKVELSIKNWRFFTEFHVTTHYKLFDYAIQ